MPEILQQVLNVGQHQCVSHIQARYQLNLHYDQQTLAE